MHEGKLTRAEAMGWLLTHPVRREIVNTSKAGANMDSIEKLKASRLAKLQAMGPVEIAKSILRSDDEHNFGIDENEFVSLVGEAARKQHPDLSEARAFAKAFTAQTE